MDSAYVLRCAQRFAARVAEGDMFRFTPRRALWTVIVPIVVTLLIIAFRGA